MIYIHKMFLGETALDRAVDTIEGLQYNTRDKG